MSSDSSPDGGPTIDFAAHLMPNTEEGIHEWIERTAGAPIHTDPDAALSVYREAGFDGAVLSQPPHMGAADAETVRRENDALLSVIEDYEPFYGLAALPVGAGGEDAAAEFERCLDAGYNGGAIETESDGVGVTDSGMEPVLEVADRTGAPLLVHPKLFDSLGPGVLDGTPKGNSIWGREVALAESIYAAIQDGLFDRYPDLTLVYHHVGGNVASMLGRVESQLREGFWPGLDDAKPYAEIERQLAERVYVDTSGYGADRSVFRRTLEAFPASNVLYGSDFPYECREAEHLTAIAEAIGDVAPATDARRIRGENALELLVNCG